MPKRNAIKPTKKATKSAPKATKKVTAKVAVKKEPKKKATAVLEPKKTRKKADKPEIPPQAAVVVDAVPVEPVAEAPKVEPPKAEPVAELPAKRGRPIEPQDIKWPKSHPVLGKIPEVTYTYWHTKTLNSYSNDWYKGPLKPGLQFNHLLIVKPNDTALGSGETPWACLCSCGNVKLVRTAHLKQGTTRSCGHVFKRAGAEKQGLHAIDQVFVNYGEGDAAIKVSLREYRNIMEKQVEYICPERELKVRVSRGWIEKYGVEATLYTKSYETQILTNPKTPSDKPRVPRGPRVERQKKFEELIKEVPPDTRVEIVRHLKAGQTVTRLSEEFGLRPEHIHAIQHIEGLE